MNQEFNKVIEDLKQDESLDSFRKEYENLFTALKASHERVKGYMNNFQSLKESLILDSYGVETALR